MAGKIRHTAAEIAAKLEQVDLLARQGRTRADIARTLGISVMTLHRWQKAHPRHAGTPTTNILEMIEPFSGRDHLGRIAELQLENSRLRRLVTDLLLEKIKHEESFAVRSKRAG